MTLLHHLGVKRGTSTKGARKKHLAAGGGSLLPGGGVGEPSGRRARADLGGEKKRPSTGHDKKKGFAPHRIGNVEAF